MTTSKQSSPFVVLSWNVLHMVHEINYSFDASPVIDKYSIRTNWTNEKFRINDMAKTITDLLKTNSNFECFICLQEVPGDLISLLQQMLDSKSVIHVKTYPRIPAIRKRQGPQFYTDINESLVTIHYNPHVSSSELAQDQTQWTQCPQDPGKGALTLTTASGLTIVNIHVPFKKDVALSLLNIIPWPRDQSPYVLVGDINRDSAKFMNLLKHLAPGTLNLSSIIPVTTDKATRIGYWDNGTLGKTWLDHYLISTSLKTSITSPAVVYDDIGDISDHYPVSLTCNL